MFSSQALHCAVSASAGGCTGLLKQRFADFSGSVQVTGKLGKAASFCGLMSKALLLLGYCFAAETGILRLTAVRFWQRRKSTQGVGPDASSALACLQVGRPLSPLLCCKSAVHLPESCRALRPLSAAVKANLERCTRVDRDFRTPTDGTVLMGWRSTCWKQLTLMRLPSGES
ncbi:hypothetical protein ABBQ32_013357 [Trebouxia sp. C0010 RCD-2024]